MRFMKKRLVHCRLHMIFDRAFEMTYLLILYINGYSQHSCALIFLNYHRIFSISGIQITRILIPSMTSSC